MGIVLVFAARTLIPLTILRWPLAGVLLSMAADALDVVFVHLFGSAPWPESFYPNYYQPIDKSFDTYYLTLAAVQSLRWSEALARRTAAVLYLWRLAGVLLLLTGARAWPMMVFPNVFENFYVFYLAARRLYPGWEIRSASRLAPVLLVCAVPKLVQEYFFHIRDATPWRWIRDTFF